MHNDTETSTDLPPLPEWLAEYEPTQHVFTPAPKHKRPWWSVNKITAFFGAVMLATAVILNLTIDETPPAPTDNHALIGSETAANAGR